MIKESQTAGSSPLARGKQQHERRVRLRTALIPARAGKTGCQPQVRHLPWAHPRSRGENVVLQEGGEADQGSSPLARGKPHTPVPPGPRGGLIPAHAGKTLCDRLGAGVSGDHPRSRGENYVRREPMQPHQGSSPLTRGKPGPCRARARSWGIIPAHAGKTGTQAA